MAINTCITINEALARIHARELLSFEVVKYDRGRKKGGQIYYIPEGKIVSEQPAMIDQHYRNFTFDIRTYISGNPTDKIDRIHMLLVTKINGLDLIF